MSSNRTGTSGSIETEDPQREFPILFKDEEPEAEWNSPVMSEEPVAQPAVAPSIRHHVVEAAIPMDQAAADVAVGAVDPAQGAHTVPEDAWPENASNIESHLLPDGLPDDAGEIMAKAFTESLRMHGLLPSLNGTIILASIWLALAALSALLPAVGGDVVWGMVFGGTLVLLLPLGEMLSEQAWRRPDLMPHWQDQQFRPVVSFPTGGALLLLMVPASLGFIVGLAWFSILAIPCSALAILWLMSARVAPVIDGFPFVHPPSKREFGAVLLGALMVVFGIMAAAVLVRMGGYVRMAALVPIVWTWIFVLRLSGLMARRYFVRVHAQQTARTDLSTPGVR